MAASLVPTSLDFMPHTLVGHPGYEDSHGVWVASGDSVSVSCRISGRRQLIRDASGREVVSSYKATIGGVPGFTVEGFRYDLDPTILGPRTGLTALAVKPVPDENGPHHEVVFFP